MRRSYIYVDGDRGRSPLYIAPRIILWHSFIMVCWAFASPGFCSVLDLHHAVSAAVDAPILPCYRLDRGSSAIQVFSMVSFWCRPPTRFQ